MSNQTLICKWHTINSISKVVSTLTSLRMLLYYWKARGDLSFSSARFESFQSDFKIKLFYFQFCLKSGHIVAVYLFSIHVNVVVALPKWCGVRRTCINWLEPISVSKKFDISEILLFHPMFNKSCQLTILFVHSTWHIRRLPMVEIRVINKNFCAGSIKNKQCSYLLMIVGIFVFFSEWSTCIIGIKNPAKMSKWLKWNFAHFSLSS
jgi:hypothetical protein